MSAIVAKVLENYYAIYVVGRERFLKKNQVQPASKTSPKILPLRVFIKTEIFSNHHIAEGYQ